MTDTCQAQNDYNGETNIRILSVFMIMISSGLGVFFPLLASKYSFIRLPDWCFFLAKFFGSGVIVATAFVHLLQPASEALSDPCLGGTFADYPWAFGICLMSLFFLFFTEIFSHYYISKAFSDEKDSSDTISKDSSYDSDLEANQVIPVNDSRPGKQHFSHEEDHQDAIQIGTPANDKAKEQYTNQVFAVFILEFGILFHSIFIGLSLAVSGDEFHTLFIVLIFHQMFEGLGLGTRVAETNWPDSGPKKWTPWLMGLAFTFVTPVAIAIGLGVRHSWVPGSRRALIANGVFDSLSSGILIYTGLVELMAHEFLYSNQFKGPGGFKKMLYAYFFMCCGAGIMALLGKWA
ncbi:hypothetical protein NCAS_0B03580 [Naumovozyma castellii]|uniref:Uncharacterized protein n=1 Tax=Naumovozyma castellii TaxID=27288 RepID=G0VBW5_NAUCA|nr:hypothetical protein NCAS_0B03580 [Naumovozyma castellii CBS 4309]CCC68442.1 hypothetical protein NCAS_0B03580 [Naumovozyma castellii CBS 4309]